jgi:hypothetical protein
VLSFFLPADGAQYIAGPVLILIGLSCSVFWFKGRFGNGKERKWIEDNF